MGSRRRKAVAVVLLGNTDVPLSASQCREGILLSILILDHLLDFLILPTFQKLLLQMVDFDPSEVKTTETKTIDVLSECSCLCYCGGSEFEYQVYIYAPRNQNKKIGRAFFEALIQLAPHTVSHKKHICTQSHNTVVPFSLA